MRAILEEVRSTLTRRAEAYLRQATSGSRVLPSYLILGAQKAGTSSLYRYLVQHPAVLAAGRKEVHFYDARFHEGESWYRAKFPTKRAMERVRRAQGAAVTGESSPYYLFHPHVPQRVAAGLPGAKFIVLLRDPVSRAYSHYQHAVRSWGETLAFEDAIAAEEGRLADETDRVLADPHYQSHVHRYFSYLARGCYADQLAWWFHHIPRERFLIVGAEEFFRETRPVIHRVLDFLEIPDASAWNPRELPRYNTGSYAPMDPATRRSLKAHFAPINAKLYDLLGRDFGWE